MAGNVRGMKNKGFGTAGGNDIPTSKWQTQHEIEPHKAGATTAGAQLKKELARSRGSMGVGNKI